MNNWAYQIIYTMYISMKVLNRDKCVDIVFNTLGAILLSDTVTKKYSL